MRNGQKASYGMLAIGFFMFVARYFIHPDRKSEMAMRVSFWSLNIGLAWMTFAKNGYWHARIPEFSSHASIRVFKRLRLPGDALFIVGGIHLGYSDVHRA